MWYTHIFYYFFFKVLVKSDLPYRKIKRDKAVEIILSGWKYSTNLAKGRKSSTKHFCGTLEEKNTATFFRYKIKFQVKTRYHNSTG